MAPTTKNSPVVFFDTCLSPKRTASILAAATAIAKESGTRAIGQNCRYFAEGETRGLPKALAAVVPENRPDLVDHYQDAGVPVTTYDDQAETFGKALTAKERKAKAAKERKEAETAKKAAEDAKAKAEQAQVVAEKEEAEAKAAEAKAAKLKEG